MVTKADCLQEYVLPGVHIIQLAYFTPINAFPEAFFKYQIQPYSGASAIPFHKRMGNVHLNFCHPVQEFSTG